MGKEQKNVPVSDVQKDCVELHNIRKNYEYLVSKFSERLSKEPIVIYEENQSGEEFKKQVQLDSVERVQTDEEGEGGTIAIYFSKDNWMGVSEGGFAESITIGDKRNSHYKITEESFQNILTMMNELIKTSGYSDVTKDKMFRYVVDNFKDKIIKTENSEK